MGWPHPDYLYEALTTEQFLSWSEYYNREPWGFVPDDLRFGMLTASVVQAAGAKVQARDFMLATAIEKAGDVEEEDDDPKAVIERLKGKLGVSTSQDILPSNG